MLSKMCKTGLKAVIYLCSQTGKDEYIGIKQIATAIDSSEHTVGKILQVLVKDNVIGSIKGPSGGYYITKEQAQTSLLKIIEAIEGCNKLYECELGLAECSPDHPCPLHNDWKPIKEKIRQLFSERKIADLCRSVDIGKSFLAG